MATKKKALLEQEAPCQATPDTDTWDTTEKSAVEPTSPESFMDTDGSFDKSDYPDLEKRRAAENESTESTAASELDEVGEVDAADDPPLDLDELLCSMDQAQEESGADGNRTDKEAKIQQEPETMDTPEPKRASRKKKAEPEANGEDTEPSASPADYVMEKSMEESDSFMEPEAVPSPASEPAPAPRRPSRTRRAEAPVLTIEARGEVETEQEREDVIWHEIHNAYRTRRMLTGQLGGIEQSDTGKTIAIVDYKGFRVIIPLKEMMINLGHMPSGQEYADLMLRQNKILGNMLGAEIDFIVMGIDSKSRSVVASRKAAMLKKRQIFYLDTDTAGMYRIYEGRIVQSRIIAVAEKVIRVEVFGVECSIMARDLSWDWIGDAHERFNVGDQVLVRVLSVRRDSLEELGIKADIKSVSQNPNQDNLKKCRIQSKYAGKVTDVHKGVVYVRLSNGANAVAHSCYDYRTPGKKDDVSFAVTRLDEERGVAVGIITRIIRQNL